MTVFQNWSPVAAAMTFLVVNLFSLTSSPFANCGDLSGNTDTDVGLRDPLARYRLRRERLANLRLLRRARSFLVLLFLRLFRFAVVIYYNRIFFQ